MQNDNVKFKIIRNLHRKFLIPKFLILNFELLYRER